MELPMNQPTPNPSKEGEQNCGRATAVPLLGGVRGGFMGPMRDSGIVEAFHEPDFPLLAAAVPAENRHS